jgi:site-specific recombinase XerD
MPSRYFKVLSTVNRYEGGPAGPYLGRFIDWLEAGGYRCVRRHVRGADHFGRWADESGLTIQQLDVSVLQTFGEHLTHQRRLSPINGGLSQDFMGARHFVAFLEANGEVEPAPSAPTPTEPQLLTDFRCWMTTHRGTMDSTLNNYQRALIQLLDSLGDQPEHYDAEALRTFVIDRAGRFGTAHGKNVVTAVRMFLRFLIAMGHCPPGLDDAIPTIAHWRLATLPKYLSAETVEQVIASCDLSTPIGVRDRAVMLLLARLGLRAGDVAGLKLTAVDWHAGTLQVAGKNRQETRLPLPQEVGDAVLSYLEQRAKVTFDEVFVTTVAPLRPLSYQTVGQIVTRAMNRVGVKASVRGANVLRHSLATTMLREGLTLPTIGNILRHASIETTAIYAKVDVQRLQQVAQPWPEVTPC